MLNLDLLLNNKYSIYDLNKFIFTHYNFNKTADPHVRSVCRQERACPYIIFLKKVYLISVSYKQYYSTPQKTSNLNFIK